MHGNETASDWVRRWSHLIAPGSTALDVACGAGRHLRWLQGLGHSVVGGLAGILTGRWRRSWLVFYWLDSLGLGLAAGVATVAGLYSGLGVTGCLILGVLTALTGGFVRDVALGDMARLVEDYLYATAAALGAMLALATLMYGKMPPWQCALAGCGLVLVLRALRLRKGGFGAV